jgi:hypothetical protein
MFRIVALPDKWVDGRGCYNLVSELRLCMVAFARPVGGQGCYNLVSEPGYNTEPGWAMLVEVEARVSERIVVKVDKIRVLSQGFNAEPEWARISGH